METTNRQSVLHSGLCSLHSPDPAPNDYRPPECRSQGAECRRGSARGNDLSVNYVTNISCVTTSHQLRLQWTLDILHILCLNPSHSLYKLYANYLTNTYWLVSFLGIPEWFIIVMSRLTQPLMWLHICLFSFQQLVVELWRLQRKCYLGSIERIAAGLIKSRTKR